MTARVKLALTVGALCLVVLAAIAGGVSRTLVFVRTALRSPARTGNVRSSRRTSPLPERI